MTLGSGGALAFDGQGWPLGDWGVFTAIRGGAMGIRNPNGRTRVLDMLPPDMASVTGWIDEATGLLVLGAVRVAEVIVIDLSDDEVIETVNLDPDPDEGLRSMSFFGLDDGGLGCLTEVTLFVLNSDGRLRWRWDHHDLSLILVGAHGETIELESAMPDLSPESVRTVLIDTRSGQDSRR